MSIRARLLWIALLATLLPALLIGRRFVQERERQIASATQRLPNIAAGIASDLSEKIQSTEQLHYGLARARDRNTQDRPACSAFLSRVREKYPQYTGILTINPDGQLFCDSLNTGRTLDLTDRTYFKQALRVGDGITMEPVFGRLTGIPVLQIAHPVRSDSGSLGFVLLASLDLAQLVKSNRQRIQTPAVEVLLMDHKGTALAWTDPAERGIRVGTVLTDSGLLRLAKTTSDSTVQESSRPDTVRLYLPRANAPSPRDAPHDAAESIPASGAETVLLVEDDELVRTFAHRQLVSLGYEVLQAPNAPEALQIIRAGAAIDLLFTDVVMPGGMSGRDLADEARKLRPGLKVLYTSGYSEDAIVHHGRLDPGVLLLNKPYRRIELASKIREALST